MSATRETARFSYHYIALSMFGSNGTDNLNRINRFPVGQSKIMSGFLEEATASRDADGSP